MGAGELLGLKGCFGLTGKLCCAPASMAQQFKMSKKRIWIYLQCFIKIPLLKYDLNLRYGMMGKCGLGASANASCLFNIQYVYF